MIPLDYKYYSYVMNNPLKYIDPSGYYRELYRPDDYDEIKERSLGGGGIDRINWPEWCRPGGPSSFFEFDYMLASAFDQVSGDNSTGWVHQKAKNGYYAGNSITFGVYQSAIIKSNGSKVGTGHYGTFQEGIVSSDGTYPVFSSRLDALYYISLIQNPNIATTGKSGVGFLQVEGRLGVPIGNLGVTTSVQFGIMFDRKGNLAAYVSPTAGVCSGGGGFCGVSWGVFPKANSISEAKNLGINAGGVYAAWGNSFAAEGNVALGPNDFRLGFTAGTKLSRGFGGMGYIDISSTIFLKSGNIYNMSAEGFANFLNTNIPNSSYSPNDALQIFQVMYNILH